MWVVLQQAKQLIIVRINWRLFWLVTVLWGECSDADYIAAIKCARGYGLKLPVVRQVSFRPVGIRDLVGEFPRLHKIIQNKRINSRMNYIQYAVCSIPELFKFSFEGAPPWIQIVISDVRHRF